LQEIKILFTRYLKQLFLFFLIATR